MPRRLWIPAAATALPVALWAARYALNATDTAPQLLFPLTMAFQFALVAALLVVIVWFYLLGGFARRVKLTVGLVALAGVGLAWASVRQVEFDGQMTPHPVFRWQPSAAERLAEFRASAPAVTGTVDPTPRPGDSPAFRGPAGSGQTPDVRHPRGVPGPVAAPGRRRARRRRRLGRGRRHHRAARRRRGRRLLRPRHRLRALGVQLPRPLHHHRAARRRRAAHHAGRRRRLGLLPRRARRPGLPRRHHREIELESQPPRRQRCPAADVGRQRLAARRGATGGRQPRRRREG